MQAFVITSNTRMMINAGVNVKNWLIQEYVIKDLFGIPVILNVNAINHEYLGYENCKFREKLVDTLVDKCTETVEEVKQANNFS